MSHYTAWMGPRRISSMHSVSQALLGFRSEQGLTQAEVADRAELSTRTVIRGENLGAGPDLTLSSLLALARALSLDITLSPRSPDDDVLGVPDEPYRW